jgi:UDP-3-O-[3-hydroxymyristoyl] glucosamine N-acyltransferase
MKPLRMTAGQIAEHLGGRVEGDAAVAIRGIAPLETAGADEVTFAADARRASRLPKCTAAAVIVDRQVEAAGTTLIRVSDVPAAVAKLLGLLAGPEDLPPAGRHATAIVASGAAVADDAALGPHVVVAAGARIGARAALCAGVYVGPEAAVGDGAVLAPGVVVHAGCRLGRRVRVGANSVIGGDGFGYYTAGGLPQRVPHVGRVVLEDDVELGACTCVDRAKFGETRIAAGTKIDNLVQIAHNVRIGRGCLLAGLTGVAGSAVLGDGVVLGGHVGVRDNIALGAGVQAGAFTGFTGDAEGNQAYGGIPAREVRLERRIRAGQKKLPDLLRRVRELEAKVTALEASADHS